MPSPSRTTRGTRKLSEVAKHLSVPVDIVSTGWPAVERTCREKLGVEFDDWQDGAGRVILAKRADGNLAAMIDGVGLSLPRQVGKTYLVGAMVFALCVNIPGLLVIWSAHHARTHGETFLAMQGFAGRQRVEPHVKQVFTGSGDEEIRFVNGSRILFGARERGFGRGIPGVDVLIFDEAQILSDKALSNMLATMNTSRFGLQLYIGTPPKPDDMSESFTRMRAESMAGTLVDGAWIEFGADRNASGDDREQWRKANPSFPGRTPAQSLLRLKRKLTEADWLREGLGIWDEADAKGGAIEPSVWLGLKDVLAKRGQGQVFAVATDQDREWCAIAVAWRRSDGLRQVMLADYRPGTAWVAERVVELRKRWGGTVIADTPSRGLVADAEEPSTPVQAQAHNALSDAVLAGTIRHGNDAALNTAVRGAKWKPYGDTRVLDRKGSLDISPLVAAALAVHALNASGPSVYEDRPLLTL